MKNQHVLFFLALACTLSCGKEEKKDDPQPPTQTQRLSAKKWQVRSSTLTSPTQPDVDLYALVRSCSQDDFVEFAAQRTFRSDEGPTKCQSTDIQTRLGVWALNANETQLMVTFNGSTTSYTIDELTDTSLRLTTNRTQSNGVVSTQKNSYVAIP